MAETVRYFIQFASTVLELCTALIILVGSLLVFVRYFSSLFTAGENLRLSLARNLALSLEFAIGSEILRTLLVRDLNELYVLAAIIVLRGGLSLLIHWEIRDTLNCLNGVKEYPEEVDDTV